MSIVEMKVPTIGESISEVTLSHWLKGDGEFVNQDEPICEFESDKATLEFPAEVSGQLIHVASEGDDLEIGALVARIDTSKVDVKEKEKEVVEEEAEVEVEEEVEAEEVEQEEEEVEGEERKEEETVKPSPAAAKLIRENELDSSSIDGSGKDGRITKADVLEILEAEEEEAEEKDKEEKPSKEKEKPGAEAKKKEEETTEEKAEAGAKKQDKEKPEKFTRNTRRKKLSRMRRTIASRLVSAKNDSAMLTTFNEVNMSGIMEIRKEYQDEFVERYGIKLGFMSIFAKACAQVLMEMPEVNAFIDDKELIYHDFVDISIAISTPSGLVVPPVRNVESLHFAEIEKKIKVLADKARDGSLSLEEMQGGTFTITNGGIFGSLMSTPIINPPQSAILGMHAVKERPVVIKGQIEIQPMMYLALSYDHRVIDGSTSVTFLVNVIELLENPLKMLLEI